MSDYADGYRDAVKMANSLVASAADLKSAHRELRHLLKIWDDPVFDENGVREMTEQEWLDTNEGERND